MFVSTRDLGVHIDGYIAVVGHTIVVGASKVKFEFWIYFWHIIFRKKYCHFFSNFKSNNWKCCVSVFYLCILFPHLTT